MIAEKLRMIKQKSTETSPANNLNAPVSQAQNISQSQLSPHSISQLQATPSQAALEISHITARLNQIRPQIPQIDKLLNLYTKLTTPPLIGSIEMVKKLTECRNILVNQLELCSVTAANTQKKSFVMNLSQLNLLIEQVQRLFNSLVAKMKESAGITGGIAKNNTTPNTTNTPNPHAVLNTKSSSISSISSGSLSSGSSITKLSSAKSISVTNVNVRKPTNINDSIDKLLLKRLSIPQETADAGGTDKYDNWIKNFLFASSKEQTRNNSAKSHLKQRNILILKELKLLKKFKFIIQEIGFGILNILVSNQNYRFIFQISQKYPYDQLIYRIEQVRDRNTKRDDIRDIEILKDDHFHNRNTQSNNNPFASFITLPKQREPKTFPFTITNVLRNFEQ